MARYVNKIEGLGGGVHGREKERERESLICLDALPFLFIVMGKGGCLFF